MNIKQFRHQITIYVGALLVAAAIPAQTLSGGLRGQVSDPSGAVVPGATVTASGPAVKVVETNGEGRFTITALAPGDYVVRVMAKGFNVFEQKVTVGSAALTVNAALTVFAEKQQVTVTDRSKVDVDPSNNAGALVLKGQDLDALSDNPDDLASDLQALAGPSAGPNGGQIFIDGFTGGRLPPKESIREVRINQNPFSAEYDRLGFGRIEIFTKPGTDKYRGQAFFNFSDGTFNSRNPYSLVKPPYQQKFFGGNVSGPISKKASFFVDAERRAQDETEVIHAITLDPAFQPLTYSNAILNPVTRTTVSPRIDYQINSRNTAVLRYTWAKTDQINSGLDTFSLPSRAFNLDNTEHTVQLTETAVLSPKAINETRFQYIARRNSRLGDNSQAAVQVLDSFTGGGSSIGLAYSDEDRYEVQNNTSLTLGRHFLKAGARIRGVSQSDYNTQNYNGTFTFSSLAAYQITLAGLASGLTPAQIRAQGGGASQFSIIGGNPVAGVTQYDVGLFVQDDFRLRPNLTVSTGLRYETQNNIGSKAAWAPRIGFAWGLGAKGRTPKMVVRGGFGIFYDRFSEDLVMQARRLNGLTQQQYLIAAPEFYPTVPSLAALSQFQLPQSLRQLDPSLRAPYMMQSAIGIERQLPKNISIAINYANTHALHSLLSRNINAPLPDSGLRPYGDIGNLFQYESSGIFNQNQLMTNVNARVSPKLTLFGFYVYGHAKSDTNGAGSFPANSYDLESEYGNAMFDVRHRVFLGGSMQAPMGLRFNPFITASSGAPFNITAGRDLNGDGLFTDRPAFATDVSRPSVVTTPWGVFDTRPMPGQQIIPLNYGRGPGQFNVNLRVSRTWGFGEKTTRDATAGGGGRGGPRMMGGGPPGGPGGGGGPRGGGGGGMRGGGGPGGMFGDASSNRHYNVTLSLSVRNLLNHVNPGSPVGTLTSPLFGQSNALAGGFFSTATANRRMEVSLRFTF